MLNIISFCGTLKKVMKLMKLFKYLKYYKKESILGPLFKLIEAVFELFVPVVVANIIDVGISNGDKTYIYKMAGVLVILGFAGLIFSVTAQFFAAKASVGFTKKLRHVLFSHIQSFSFTELDEIGTASLITRMTGDMNQVQTGLNMGLRLLLRSPLVVFGSMIMAFFIDARESAIFAVSIVVLSVIVFLIMYICIPLYKKVQLNLEKILSTTRENLIGVRVLRAFCKESEEAEKFDSENSVLTDIQKYTGRISALMNPLTYVVVNLAIIWLVYTGAIGVEEGRLTQGAVVALYNYMSQILVELIKFANLVITITKSIACGNRIQAILDIVPSMEDGEKLVENAKDDCAEIEFSHVSLTYKNAGDEALSDITFSCKLGETVGIIGGTGSGKSSLVHLIPRFYDATVGNIYINGVNIKNYKISDLRRKIGIVQQKAVLFSGTIRENLKWRKNNATDEEIMAAISLAQATDFVVEKQKGLDFFVEQGGKNLSGGQRQRLAIARALVGSPEILILDDSASALDFATEAKLRHDLRNLSFKPTVFIVSQRVSSISHADKILVLDDGNLVSVGTHNELLTTCDVYKEIFESQGGVCQ